MSVITVRRTVIKQAPGETSIKRLVINGRPKKAPTTSRSFRELARRYFTSENRLEFAIEALFFAIIVATSAWPILAAAGALTELFQRAPT
jgi:hypothetical protein